ncbi:DNA N-6-adenine-methyltransferase [Paraburkholderia sediminicola]|uniref:DNA N-6-adenine-methyltransferase n=1 Tax=Paraburkholderia sediminicola TaxID=458836 RepID=UPI0038BC589A
MSGAMTMTNAGMPIGYVGSAPGAKRLDSDAWFTPPVYIEAARAALGGIGFDPYSSDAAQDVVRAEQYCTLSNPNPERGVSWPKVGTCWMNPPYSHGVALEAATRFLEAFDYERFERGIVLVNNATETRMFRALSDKAAAICFTNHRIQFYNTDGKAERANTRGQAFLYFDRTGEPGLFAEHFRQFGTIMRVL